MTHHLIKKLDSKEVRELLQLAGVKKDTALSEKYLFDIYEIEGKILVVLANGTGHEYPNRELFISHNEPFIKQLKDIQKRSLKTYRKTVLLPKQVQSLLNEQEGWSPQEEDSESHFEHQDGRTLVVNSNQSGTLYLPNAYHAEATTSFNQENVDDGNFGSNVIIASEDQNRFSASWEYPEALEDFPDFVFSNAEDWLFRTISYYRDLSFFNQYASWKLQGLQEQISRIRSEFNSHLEKYNQLIYFYSLFYDRDSFGKMIPCYPNSRADLELLEWDTQRTWHTDEFFQYLDSNQRYTISLERLREISRGIFNIDNIHESWNNKSVEITFTWDKNTYSLVAKADLGRFDGAIIGSLNRIVKNTGYLFDAEGMSVASHDPFEKMLVVMLNREEQIKLRNDKDLFFNVGQ